MYTARKMSKSTKEYDAIVRATARLELAVRHNITQLCAELVSCGLITPDQSSRLRNVNHDVAERAADLVGIITNKVEQDPNNYYIFVNVLQENEATYSEVLHILELPSLPVPAAEAPTTELCGNFYLYAS